MTRLFAAIAAACAFAITAQAATLPATPATFGAVLAKAQGGDVLALEAGDYVGLDYAFYGKAFSPAVTITSADPAHPARIASIVGFSYARGLNFTGLEFVIPTPGYFQVGGYNCADVHFDRVNVHGSQDGDPSNDAEGIGFSSCENVSVTNSEFHDLLRALSIGSSAHVLVDHNRFHDLDVTGMAIGGGSSDVAITFNSIGDLFPLAGEHPDAIQFLTAGQVGTTRDVRVTDNFIFKGRGQPTQGIFFRDQTTTQPYANVTVARNLIVGTGYGGIAIDYTNGLTVDGNLAVSFDPPDNYTPIQIFASTGVSFTNNAANVWSVDSSDVVAKIGNTDAPRVADRGVAAMTAWAAAHPDMAALIAPLLPPPPVTPPPAPAPAPDPRDARIADLEAQLAQAAGVSADLAAKLTAANARGARFAAALQTVIAQGTAANAKRQGPTKSDVAAIIAGAKAALTAN